MASAIVTALRGSGKNVEGGTDLVATMFFSGSSVPLEVEGQPYEHTVRLPVDYSLAQFTQAIVDAAIERGSMLGVVILATEVEVPSYDRGV